MVEFTFTGTREAISNAELLIQYTLKHLKEMEEMREVVDELHRKIHPRNSPVAYYHNGHVNGQRSGASRSNASNNNQNGPQRQAPLRSTGNGRGFYSNKPSLNSSKQKNIGKLNY